MKLFSAHQTKQLDQFTIANEPISSLDLMERASEKVALWIENRYPNQEITFEIFCGPGNNGGDGLAVGRMLARKEYAVHFHLIAPKGQSPDNQSNWSRIPVNYYVKTNLIQTKDDLPNIDPGSIIVDAIFGYGLDRAPAGIFNDAIDFINNQTNKVISIDVPTGLLTEAATTWTSVTANHTLTFEFPKLSFFMPENQDVVGIWEVLEIGLHPQGKQEIESSLHFIDENLVRRMFRPRNKFDHKGTFGHAFLICGQMGKIGAACLAARACMRSGVGLLTVHVPQCGVEAIHFYCPEAMVSADKGIDEIVHPPFDQDYDAIGIGCGIGTSEAVQRGFANWLVRQKQPLVIDADGLNLLALNKDLLKEVPKGSILTPHPGEYKRLFGEFANNFERLDQQCLMSTNHQLYIVLKGSHTCITTPEGGIFFNGTGNPGMATAGSGDTLTGILTGILAQGYSPEDTCVLGVYLHGLAGDLAKASTGAQALVASDITKYLGMAWQQLEISK